MNTIIIFNTIIKQYQTGGYSNSNDFLFKIWEIPNNVEEEVIERIIEESKKQKIDFIVQQKNETLDFMHVSYTCYKESIEKEGLKCIETDWINDLGFGIYVVEEGDEVALDNLKNYVENHEDNELLLVKGHYEGFYLECIHGYEHEGYISIKNDISADSLEVETMLVEDFLMI